VCRPAIGQIGCYRVARFDFARFDFARFDFARFDFARVDFARLDFTQAQPRARTSKDHREQFAALAIPRSSIRT